MVEQQSGEPRISVILPCYNGERFIGHAIDVVLGQTYEDLELVIVDDGSADESGAVVARYLGDPRIGYVKHEVNRGIPAARNTGIRSARGEYIAFLDQDDS